MGLLDVSAFEPRNLNQPNFRKDYSPEVKAQLHTLIDTLPSIWTEAKANKIITGVAKGMGLVVKGTAKAKTELHPDTQDFLKKMTPAKLEKMDLEELKETARKVGISTKGRIKAETLIERLTTLRSA